jgi:hypothetical protein
MALKYLNFHSWWPNSRTIEHITFAADAFAENILAAFTRLGE